MFIPAFTPSLFPLSTILFSESFGFTPVSSTFLHFRRDSLTFYNLSRRRRNLGQPFMIESFMWIDLAWPSSVCFDLSHLFNSCGVIEYFLESSRTVFEPSVSLIYALRVLSSYPDLLPLSKSRQTRNFFRQVYHRSSISLDFSPCLSTESDVL
jgi:hypothetical protein